MTGLRLTSRTSVVLGCLVVVAVVFAVLAIGYGDYPMSTGDVLRTLAGQGSRFDYLIVMQQRLPRVLVAALVGIALALAGAVFQTLTRNPLGSPDIIGFTTGSATGGVVTILLVGSGTATVALGALAGGIVTAVLVTVLCGRRGLRSERLVLIGIGLAFVLAGINSYLLSRATTEGAAQATTWMVGNLAGRGWNYLWPILIAVVVLVPLLALAHRPLHMLEMGDDAATAIGVDVPRARPLLFAVAVALTAVAVATAGPVPFVALAAPHLARGLTRMPGPNLLSTAVLGATLVIAADYLGQRLLSSSLLPVGVVTAAIGGTYLAWLLLLGRRAA
jgi:iron complex transport system permease protein